MVGPRNKSARRTVRRRGRPGPEVVQLRPAWADSVLMYWGSPVPYPASGLDEALTAALQAWDTASYDRVGPDAGWRSAAAAAAHRVEGSELAQRTANALGSAVAVAVAVEFDERIVRSPNDPTSPSAAATFRPHGRRQEAELHEALEQREDPGHGGAASGIAG